MKRGETKKNGRSLAHLLVLLSVVSVLMSSPQASAAQEATPSSTQAAPVGDGILGFASREFTASGTRPDGTATMAFLVAEFDTAEHAEQAVPLVSEFALRSVPKQGTLVETSAPTVGDATLAYTGTLDNDGTTVDAAVLTFRDGQYVHAWFASGRAADPLRDLITVADRLLQGTSPSLATPASEHLVDRLPALRDMPAGFVLVNQDMELAAQPVGTPVT